MFLPILGGRYCARGSGPRLRGVALVTSRLCFLAMCVVAPSAPGSLVRHPLPSDAHTSDQLPDMKLSLEHLAFLPPGCALALLLAVAPLCRARRDAQDYLAMLLRKAMFRCGRVELGVVWDGGGGATGAGAGAHARRPS